MFIYVVILSLICIHKRSQIVFIINKDRKLPDWNTFCDSRRQKNYEHCKLKVLYKCTVVKFHCCTKDSMKNSYEKNFMQKIRFCSSHRLVNFWSKFCKFFLLAIINFKQIFISEYKMKKKNWKSFSLNFWYSFLKFKDLWCGFGLICNNEIISSWRWKCYTCIQFSIPVCLPLIFNFNSKFSEISILNNIQLYISHINSWLNDKSV